MKKIYFSLMMTLMATLTFAQPKEGGVKRNDLKIAASKFQHFGVRASVAKAPLLDEIISEQPAGTLKTYLRTGNAMMGSYGWVYEFEQNGSVAKVVFGDDGESVYFYMPLSQIFYPAWVKGTLSADGTTISIPAGQEILFDITEPDPWEDYPGGEEWALRLHLMEVKDLGDGAYTYDVVEGDPDIVWTVDQTTGELKLTSTDFDGYTIMGCVYDCPTDPELDQQWNGYADYATVYVPFSDEPTVMPEGLETTEYSMLYEKTDFWSGTVKVQGKTVDVAFDDDNVYITRFSASYPEACLKGTIKDGKIFVPRQLLLVDDYSDAVYFNAYNTTEIMTDWGPEQHFEVNYDDIVFDYDPETRSFSTDMNCNVNPSAIAFSGEEMFEKPSFKVLVDVEAIPADPFISYFDGYEAEKGFLSWAYYDIPTADINGDFINPDKLSFCFYTSETELYHFVRDNYVFTEEVDGYDFAPEWSDGMTEIPYNFTDDSYDITHEHTYFRYGEIERLGLQSIYRGGGVERRSNIYFYNEGIVVVKILPVNGTAAMGKETYDLQGRRVNNAKKGIYMQTVKQADGKTTTRKVVLR